MQSPQPRAPSRVTSELEDVIVTTGHIRAVFRKSLPKPKPEFPAQFMDLVPVFGPDVLEQESFESKELIDSLGLDLQRRLQLVTFLVNDSEFTDKSRNNQLFAAYLCLQSFSALFFANVATIDPDGVSTFVKGMRIAERYVPELIDLIFRSFYYFYHRLIGAENCMKLIRHTDEFFEVFSEQTIPKYYLPKLIDVTATVLQSLCDDNLQTVCHHLNLMAKILSEQPLFTPDDMTNVGIDLELAAKLAMNEVAKGEGLGDNAATAFRFGIELSRLTSQEFPQIAPYFNAMISTPKVTEMSFSGQPDPSWELRQATPYSIEGKELTAVAEPLTTENFSVREVPDFLELLNEHPITRVVNALGLVSSASQFTVFSLMFKHGAEEIPKGDLNFLSFMLLFVYNQKISDVYKTANFLNEQKGYSVFFPESLFRIDNSIFDDNLPVIVSLRKFAIDSFAKLFTRINDENMLEYFAQGMNSVAEYPHLFAEFMHLSSSFLNKERTDSIFKAMGRGFRYIQYALRDPSYPRIREVATMALKELEELFQIDSFLAAIANSKSGCEMLIELMADNCFAETAENFFRRTFEFTRQFPEMAAFHGLAQACANAIKQGKQISKMFGIVDTILKQSKRSYILEVCKSPLFEAVQTFIVNVKDVADLEIPLNILKYSVFRDVYREVTLNWKDVAAKLGSLKLNEETYKTMRLILSGSWKSYTGINNGDAVYLLLAILKSSYAMEFVQELLGIITSDAVQCLHLFIYNSVPIFVEFLNSTECTPELYEAVMMIVIRVISFVCDRNTLKEFFRVFGPSNGYQNGHTQQLCQYLLSAMIDDPINQRSLFHFNTQNSYVFLPRLPIEMLTEGCSFVFNLCLMELKGPFCLFSLSTGDKHYTVLMDKENLLVKSNAFSKDGDMKIPLKYPVNEWFNLCISMRDFGNLTIYINGSRAAQGHRKFSHWSCGAERFILFRAPAGVFPEDSAMTPCEGFLGEFWILKEPVSDLGKRKVDLQPSTNEKRLFGWYSPAATQDKRIKNLCPGKTDFALFDLAVFPYVNTFSRVFEQYGGLHHVLALFEQLELPMQEGQVSVIPDLFGILQFVLEFSEDIQRQMLKIDGFQIIANHLHKVKPELLDILVWKKVMMLECSITNQQLMLSFYRDMVWLFENWMSAPRKVVNRYLNHCRDITTKEPKHIVDSVGISYIISLIYERILNGEMDAKEKAKWVSILGSVSAYFQESDLYLVGQLIMKMIDNPEKSLLLLNLFSEAPIEKPKTIRNVLYEFISHENVMEASCPQFVLKVLDLFVRFNREELPRMLSCQIKESKNRSEQQNNEFVVAFSNALISRSGLPLNELANVRIVEKLDISVLPFLVAYLWNCSKEQRDIVEHIFRNLMANSAYLANLSESLNATSLLLLLAYDSLVSNSFSDILADILLSKAELVAQTFEIMGLIAHATKTNQLQYAVKLANDVIVRALEKKSYKAADLLIDITTSFVLTDRTLDYSSGESTTDLLSVIEDIPEYNPVVKEFQAKLNPAYSQTALKLVQFIDNKTISSASREKLLAILFLLCDPELNLSSEICPLLDGCAKFLTPSSLIMSGFVAQIKPRISEYSSATAFCEKVESFTESSPAPDATEVIGKMAGPVNDVVQQLDMEFNCVQESYEHEPVLVDDVLESVKAKKQAFLEQCDTKAEDLRIILDSAPRKTGKRRRWNAIDDSLKPFVFVDTEKRSSKDAMLTDKCVWSSTCERVTFNSRKRGTLYLTTKEIYFHSDKKYLCIRGADVLCLFWNWNLHVPNAFTLITRDVRCFLFVITGVKTRDFLAKITEVSMPNCLYIQDQSPSAALDKLGMTRKWKNGTMSNCEYLSWLNILSGRTFMDPDMYPIFPVLFFTGTDGSRQSRDLTKNVAEIKGSSDPTHVSPFDAAQRYLFESSYSSSSVVRSLLRPLNSQPTDPLFQSPADLMDKLRTGEVHCELTPEFFTVPEIFEGQELPPWCRSPVDFVYQHIKALESPEVTAALPKWIDMIWGVNQLDPSNSYDPRLYPNVWEHQIENHGEVEELLRKNGQIPQQVFTAPHPFQKEKEETKGDVQIMAAKPSKILAFGVASSVGPGIKIFTAHKNETIYSNEFPGSISPLEHIDLKWLSLIQFSPNMSIVYSQLSSNSFSFINSKRKKVLKPRDCDVQLSTLKQLAIGEFSIVTAAEDGSIYAWDYDLTRRGRLFAHDAPITVIEVVDHLHTLISCDESGKVVISLLPSLAVINTIDTGIKANAVVCPKRMGIIVVYSDTVAKSYTLNGTPLCEKQGRGRITCACQVGYNYAIVVGDEVILCDAITLEPTKFLYKHGSQISGMTYLPQQHKLVLTTEENQLILVGVY